MTRILMKPANFSLKAANAQFFCRTATNERECGLTVCKPAKELKRAGGAETGGKSGSRSGK